MSKIKEINMGKIVSTEWKELFKPILLLISIVLSGLSVLILYIPIRDDIESIKKVMEIIMGIHVDLLTVSISYMLFAITLIFTVWSKKRLLTLKKKLNREIYSIIFSVYFNCCFYCSSFIYHAVF